ncbi:ATP binding L-PSP endoribonuclease family protein-like protein [Xylogone sp. PMI_703]|nr:ATP binding L-PSP endoribonuclease family protein-like protein [Xylogone sp. PMI_703]
MPESLNVIALISGGKDSFFSILHCLQNGHKIVVLANLYPPTPEHPSETSEPEGDEHDLNSFMYQTVGHSVIPLYEKALGIPLYRQPITGSARQTEASYDSSRVNQVGEGLSETEEDETESLVPLLKRIMAAHPSANALSTGAILSTYQRTRVESVAVRLGLVPLAFLWKYPILPPGTQDSLLYDMSAVGLDARIAKVASGGLDESYLWENVASARGITRIGRAMSRFGSNSDGAVLGEGGEFETLVVDGPGNLFKGRIEVSDKKAVREGGGSVWLQIRNVSVVMKPDMTESSTVCRTPNLLGERFLSAQEALGDTNSSTAETKAVESISRTNDSVWASGSGLPEAADRPTQLNSPISLTVGGPRDSPLKSITEEAEELITQIRYKLQASSHETTDIISTLIILRSMEDFASINKAYGALFTHPNPPSRVTISSGDMMPHNCNIMIHLNIQSTSQAPKSALHVQSRSYWAPANIGPYSQAISIPVYSLSQNESSQTSVVYIAGQIPLVPHTMTLPLSDPLEDPKINFRHQTILSLQHLWRIGQEMRVGYWTSAIAYLPQDSPLPIEVRSVIASKAWSYLNTVPASSSDEDETEERDIWEEKFYRGRERMGDSNSPKSSLLPDPSVIKSSYATSVDTSPIPMCFAAEVAELPRASAIEWHAHQGIVKGPVSVAHSQNTRNSVLTKMSRISCFCQLQVRKTGLFNRPSWQIQSPTAF